jgi:hypothetical protein
MRKVGFFFFFGTETEEWFSEAAETSTAPGGGLVPEQKSKVLRRRSMYSCIPSVHIKLNCMCDDCGHACRSKLKQTEVDCEYLKRWCEKLAQENRRLQREVADLRRLCSAAYPFYGAAAGFGVATARVCPSSCDNDVSEAAISGAPSAAAPPPSTLFASWPPHFGPFTVVVPPLLRRQPSATTSWYVRTGGADGKN